MVDIPPGGQADATHRIEKSILCNVPVRTAYYQWTQFESFPLFMEGIEQVEQVDDANLHWVARIAGKRVEWDARIIAQEPDRIISWESTSGSLNNGAIRFESISPGSCRITLTLTYEPEGIVENVGSALGVVQARVEGDLKRFKDFVEARRVETGKWRGEVKGGKVEMRDPGTLSGERES